MFDGPVNTSTDSRNERASVTQAATGTEQAMTTATQIPLPPLQSLEPNPKQATHDRGDLSDRLMAPR